MFLVSDYPRMIDNELRAAEHHERLAADAAQQRAAWLRTWLERRKYPELPGYRVQAAWLHLMNQHARCYRTTDKAREHRALAEQLRAEYNYQMTISGGHQ